jgi:DNA-binding NarL/FixJ family response regulator
MMIFLIHNEPLVGAGLRAILSDEPDIKIVGEGSDDASAATACRASSPDVVVISAGKLSEDGTGVESTIRRCGAMAVLVMGEEEDGEVVRKVLAAGAKGYLSRRAPTNLIIQTLRIISNGGIVVPERLRRNLFADPVSDLDMRDLRRMTPREHAILGYLAHGMTNTEIASALFLSEATVKKHVSHILRKFQLHNRLQAGLFGYRLGLGAPDGEISQVASTVGPADRPRLAGS